MTPQSGTRIGAYECIAPLKSGGTANLWKARHTLSEKLVAIKILNPENNIQRVRNEARLQSSILHPNIVSIFEFIWMGNRPCIVMELVEGWTLQEFLKVKSTTESQRLHLVEQLLNAIQYLHEKKIIHRDLKPQNIMVRRDGTLLLLDFGIAKGWSSPNITKEGTAIGTPEYMAPERFEGYQSAQSDIWAIGLIIYEMCRGETLFPKLRNTGERKTYFTKSYIDPQLVTISAPWKKVIAKCLKTNPKNRYPSIGAIFTDLSISSGSSIPRSPFFAGQSAMKIGLFTIGLLLIGFLLWNKYSTEELIACEGTQIQYNLKPSSAILKTSRGEALKKGAWQLCGEAGDAIQITITAKGYRDKSFRFTFPTLDDNLTYVLEKK